ncbi:DUF551 domain-containing protein [Salmonella enterica]|uniref:DUF551 domain-containing protein n=1 Tax=Salmonella enterica subsp. enterica serovar Alachua TaxID=913240 RepID=A0A730ME40_SALET|nr:DUF551 domain-containing protein [Salmonella enterica]ECF7534015.1 DUF551 domain-containing protein [Salmonella enterica subsp. enterica]EDW4326954.1 DUF551 domain-containing protein [Salmonella enterica subsp. enterica serovar Cerro]EAS1354259.1 DUF551 domain-containing protein [Salmonella enterica subsp. enterica serovar Alachua]EAV1383332.1 DUF551 domain-containing protein [Salmonella enterica]EAW8440377.1 DUF551 domain-containing protein [Salmonella enterica]
MTITKERLLKIQHWRETYGADSNVMLPAEEAAELARIALASLEVAPYGYVHKAAYEQAGSCGLSGDHEAYRDSSTHIAVYTATPAPVSVPAAMEIDDDFDSAFEHGKAVGWNAYRAAMLQAEPVSNSDELPLDYLQGHKDGLEWAAQLAEANHPQTGDWLYDDPIDLARAIRKGPDMPTVQGGNSPVTPDGWISCSEWMPAQDDWVLIYSKHGEYLAGQVQGEYVELNDGTLSWLGAALHWMPLPAPPQQEVK